jgi:ribosomal protein S18 acetylase RimI-like enzyme
MLTFAASMGGTVADEAEARANPDLRPYVEDFGRPGDLGVVAWRAERRVGAAWLRLAPWGAAPSPSKVWSAEQPELAIAVEPDVRGSGAGGLMLAALLGAAAGRYPSVGLSVREGNAAVHLYERFGFLVERTVTNRAGGVSLVMRRLL